MSTAKAPAAPSDRICEKQSSFKNQEVEQSKMEPFFQETTLTRRPTPQSFDFSQKRCNLS